MTSLLDTQTTHPREAKDTLAKVIVEEFHSMDAANAASAEFRRRFTEGQLPSDMETHKIAEAELPLVKLIAQIGFAASNGEARRLIQQGAVSWGDAKVSDVAAVITIPAEPMVLKVGKRRVCRVVKS
jgi:tyrosyl-tRNA synthetase